MRSAKVVLGLLFLVIVPPVSVGEDSKLLGVNPEEQLLRAANLDTDEKLLAFVRKRTGSDEELLQLDQLIRSLGDRRFAERGAAAGRIVKLGPAAFARLDQARQSPDKEIARQAKLCAQEIEKDFNSSLELAVVRQLIRSRPDGAVSALLRFLPFAAGEELQEELWFGLYALAARQDKPEAAFEKALVDPVPTCRALAGLILGRRGDAAQRNAAKKLLKDTDTLVRLRTAQGLLAGDDLAGLPALVELLEKTPVLLAWQAEELLHYVAGEDGPLATIGSGSDAARKKCREGWATWWRETGTKLDPAKLSLHHRRPGLVLFFTTDTRFGRIWVCGCDSGTRLELTDLNAPTDVHLLPEGRLLVAQEPLPKARSKITEKDVIGVTERDLEGKIVWQYGGAWWPLACRREPTGNTRIVNSFYKQPPALEVNREGEAFPSTEFEPKDGSRLRGGGMLVVVSATYRNRVVEIDDSKGVWDAPVQWKPNARVCLPLVRLCFDHPRPEGHSLERAPYLVKGLKSKHAAVRRLAAGGLWERDHEAKTVVPALIDALDDTEQKVTEVVSKTLLELGPAAVEPVRAAMKDKRPRVRAGAVGLLSGYVRRGYFGPDSGKMLSEVMATLNDEDPLPRRAAIFALQALPKHNKEVVAALVKALKDPDRVDDPNQLSVARAAALHLQWLGAEAKDAVPALIEALDAKDHELRVRAIAALMKIGEPAKAAIPKLIDALQPSDVKDPVAAHHIRMSAALALGEMGPEAKVAIPAIERVLREADDQYRQVVRKALEKLKR